MPVDDGCSCSAGRDDGDGFAFEVDVFEVGAGGYEDGVAWGCGVDAGLDGGLAGGDIDDGGVRPGRGQNEEQKAEGLEQGGGAQGSRLRVGDEFLCHSIMCSFSEECLFCWRIFEQIVN